LNLESAVISTLQAKGVARGTIVTVRSYNGYATALVTVGDSTVVVYLRHVGLTWQALHVVGGVASAAELQRYGVPASAAVHLRSGVSTATYVLNRRFGVARVSHTPASNTFYYTRNANQRIVYACKQYLQAHGGQSLTVTRGVSVTNYGLCWITGIEGGAEVLVRRNGASFLGVGMTRGVMVPSTMAGRFHVPLKKAILLSTLLFPPT
jgi:hypothetical protein